MSSRISANETWKNAAALHSLFYLIAPIFVFLLIASLPLLRDPAAMRPSMFLLIVYLYELVSIAVFTSEGSPRYEASFYLLPLLITCILYGQATRRLCKRDHVPHLLDRSLADPPVRGARTANMRVGAPPRFTRGGRTRHAVLVGPIR